MKVALVHDYLNEFGGAERVLQALSDLFPEAPIYTAFQVKNSAAAKLFVNKTIIESWAAKIPFFKTKLHSPLRFLAPSIWRSFNFRPYDLVISSSSWFLTKGIITHPPTVHLAYIHTPPRFLYGYETATKYQKYWPIKLYAALIGKYLKYFDQKTASNPNVLIANSKEVQARIKKFWHRDSVIIYPPVELQTLSQLAKTPNLKAQSYYLTGGRLVAPKHFDLAIQVANQQKLHLKIFGTGPEESNLKHLAGPTVEFLGKVSESKLVDLYSNATAFIALAADEDFGITPVESMLCGTPVVAYQGGGYQETVIEGTTGIFIKSLTVESLKSSLEKLHTTHFDPGILISHAQKFSTQRFNQQILTLINQNTNRLTA